MLGLRVRPDLALVRVPAGMIPTELVDPAGQTVEIVGADSKREIALVKLPAAVDSTLEATSEAFSGFAYLGQATATVDGPTVQPVFIGRTGAASTRALAGRAHRPGQRECHRWIVALHDRRTVGGARRE